MYAHAYGDGVSIDTGQCGVFVFFVRYSFSTINDYAHNTDYFKRIEKTTTNVL